MSAPLKRLAVVGECMLEFYHMTDAQYHLGFAGDVFNMAYYFAYASAGKLTVDMVSAVGADPYSQKMLKTWSSYGVRGDLTRIIHDRLPGLYLVETDEHGERDFIYYRENAAARYMFEGSEGTTLLNQLLTFDAVYFSGITLAILKAPFREKFLHKLRELHERGVVVIFDCNYRPRLWPSVEVAQACINLVMPYVHIARPSLGDCHLLFGDNSIDQCVDRYLERGVKKVIASESDKGYMIASSECRQFYPVEPVKAVDTTGAGDAFSGAYVAGFMRGLDDETACEQAAQLSARVVQNKGAIVDSSLL